MTTTRRDLLSGTCGLFAIRTLLAQQPTLTANAVIERIKQNVGVPWRAQTVDTIKAGSAETIVIGVATAMGATFDVLRRALAAKRNFVVVHEPTFYSGAEDEFHARQNPDDPLVKQKKAFIEDNQMVVWRFHDHWHAAKPDGIIRGMGTTLGWQKYQAPDNVRLYHLPKQSLADLAAAIKEKLRVKAIRVIGDPQTQVSTVSFNPGSTPINMIQRIMSGDEVDVLVCGEPGEWDSGEYVRDTVATGRKKGMIVLGHYMSEEGGMSECARWLSTFITEVPVEFMPAGEAFWTPRG
jgi:putative NIF3 family GTP cyclohydrolase 1 type 2